MGVCVDGGACSLWVWVFLCGCDCNDVSGGGACVRVCVRVCECV